VALVVTTSDKPREAQVTRARALADRLALPYVRRRGPLQGFCYVVGRSREELRDGATSLTVHEGMLKARLQSGSTHPLIRAIGPASHVIDGTLGLAGDALHIASALTCRVTGIEGSPVIHALLEEGLTRLGQHIDAANRITLCSGEAAETLARLGPADAVFLAPMYERPRCAAPGFELLRRVAIHDPLSPSLLRQAHRVAPRVIVKIDRGEPALPGTSMRIRGRAVDYLVLDRP
jgi:hypothetical protein